MTSTLDQPAYRLAMLDDVDALVDLRLAFLTEVSHAMPAEEVMRAAMRAYFAQAVPAGEFIAYVAEVAGRPIATSGLVYHRGPPSPKNMHGCEAYVLNVYTLPEWRGQGIATALLARLVEHARPHVCRVALHAVPAAHSLYRRAGFVPRDPEIAELRLDFSAGHERSASTSR